MEHLTTDTIVAIATPPGESAIAILRLSGPTAPQILAAIFKSHTPVAQFNSHHLYLGKLTDEDTPLDHAMAVWMKAPRSYTGEECVEVHTHGSPALLRKALSLALKHGARLARPGEFSERAFLNEKLDLTQAEAVCDLIHAKSEKALALSFRQLSGVLKETIDGLKLEIIEVKARLEAGLDFPEEDLSLEGEAALIASLQKIETKIEALIQSFERGRIVREGVRVLIVGKPNVGKSSLLNALLGEDRAIVDEAPGTTRDFIDETLSIDGLSVRLIDTAGIRLGVEKIEAEGIKRTLELFAHADLALALFDGSRPLDGEDEAVLTPLLAHFSPEKILALRTKSDLKNVWETPPLKNCLPLSVFSQKSITHLKSEIVARALPQSACDAETAPITHLRHKESLLLSKACLDSAIHALKSGLSGEYPASDLNHAIEHLKEITGEITNDDVLDKLFREFCIGK